MGSLADHTARTAVRRTAGFGPLYPEEIEYLNRPAMKDSEQPDCVHCKCSFTEHCANWLVGACRKCCCTRYEPF